MDDEEHQNTFCGSKIYLNTNIAEKWEEVTCLRCWKSRGIRNDKLNQKQKEMK